MKDTKKLPIQVKGWLCDCDCAAALNCAVTMTLSDVHCPLIIIVMMDTLVPLVVESEM